MGKDCRIWHEKCILQLEIIYVPCVASNRNRTQAIKYAFRCTHLM